MFFRLIAIQHRLESHTLLFFPTRLEAGRMIHWVVPMTMSSMAQFYDRTRALWKRCGRMGTVTLVKRWSMRPLWLAVSESSGLEAWISYVHMFITPGQFYYQHTFTYYISYSSWSSRQILVNSSATAECHSRAETLVITLDLILALLYIPINCSRNFSFLAHYISQSLVLLHIHHHTLVMNTSTTNSDTTNSVA